MAVIDRVRDLPVAVVLPSSLAGEVSAYVEGELGWQVVGLDGPPRPALILASAPVAGRATVVVVDGPVAPAQLRTGFQAGAVDVVGWPAERERLGEVAARALQRPTPTGGPPLVRVAGAAGGVGTSTVTLALAGLLAWAGRRVLVAGDADLLRLAGLAPWRGPGVDEVALLDPRDAAGEVRGLARPVPGVPGLRALGGDGRSLAAVTGWPADIVVADVRAGAAAGCELRCARPDAHLCAVVGETAPVVVIGDGALDAAGVRRVLGHAPAGRLPRSARVARAGLRGRVPADLPGSWLRALRAASGAVHSGTPRIGQPRHRAP